MTRVLFLATTIAAATLALSVPSSAAACGGFFCNANQPVNQAAERIIFSKGADGTVTAIIQIQYSGPSESFAWMLPVDGNPDVAVSSDLAFQRLQTATNPQYNLNTTVEGTCRSLSSAPPSSFGGGGWDASGPSSDASADAGSPVTVVNQGSVGPFDFVVIAVDPEQEDRATTAIEWLTDNNYDVNDFAADRLRPYLDGGMNLLAFRLTKGNDAGSIRPVRLTFGSGAPSIPIRPTAVAAENDMGVMVWVLGEHRAVPSNYLSLELNDALINWFNSNSNYNDVVTRAANEAGGQGFVTELAGEAAPLASTIFQDFERGDWDRLAGTSWTNQEGQLLDQAGFIFGAFDGARDAILQHLPLPDGVTSDQLIQCIRCYYPESEADIEGFDPEAFIATFEELVIEPMDATRKIFEDHPYVTRLYTTMSADEMTKDPIFDFNPDLGELSNVHTADRVIECAPTVRQTSAPWRTTLPNGQVIRGTGNQWPTFTNDEMPANARISRVGTSGDGETVTDNVAAIGTTLTGYNATIPPPTPANSNCSVGRLSGSGIGVTASLALLVVLFLRRRR
ncbi:MAG: DUF2330 domain-containing protein [Myxococcota bacterium]